MAAYRAKAGEMLDEICWMYYGQTSGGVVEKVLDANPGLAFLGPRLPAGTLVELPDIEIQTGEGEKFETVWD